MRSVVVRMLWLTLAVAFVAVAATAWVANRETSRQVRSAVEADVETEEAIYEALSFYALANGSWEGVGEEVDSLARVYDERIALTTIDGDLIADSAGRDGEPAQLPDAPVRYIAPDSPVISFDAPVVPIEGLEVILDEGAALADLLASAGVEFALEDVGFGIEYPVWADDDPVAGAIVERYLGAQAGDELDAVVPVEVLEGLAAEWMDLAEHLDERDIGFRMDPIGDLGVPFIEWDLADPEANRVVGEFFVERSGGGVVLGDLLPVGLPSEPAEPALLFLGLPVGETVPDPVGWRLVGAVALVAIGALVVTFVLGRRVLAPVGALTRAVRAMEGGDRAARVPVRGGDEFAELAGAFNAMASSLEEQDRLRRAMAADVAHELRTPLSNIRGYLEALQEGVADPTPEVLASIHEEALQLQRLIDDLQVLSLAEAGELQMDLQILDLCDVAAQAVSAHRPAAEAAGVQLRAQCGSPVEIRGDRARLRQVVGNLLDNALRHTPSGGTVTVSVTAESGRALLAVTDTGPGIAPEHLPHVFDRFYRADPSRSRETGGTGLGLSIGRELVRAHGGDLTVAPADGGGTVFRAWIPPAPPEPPAAD
jgi:two-component system sensor histidine kinase BaeS